MIKQTESMRYLGMPMQSARQWLDQMQNSKYLDYPIDMYNSGELVTKLENKVAKLLGKPAALFFPKGMVAQLCALKVATETRSNNSIILHPKSHIALDEENSYQSLLGLQGILLGKNNAQFNIQQINDVAEPISALTVELPLRRAGFKLPDWSELIAMQSWCNKRNIHFHMDGARLWESTEFYQKTEAEMSQLFDSVYVSLYKGVGSLGGSVLAGEKEFINQCKVWRTRFGGDFFTSFPMLITALDGLDNQLDNMSSLVIRAKEIAGLLSQFKQIQLDTPQTNGFFIFINGNHEMLNKKAIALNHKMNLKLFNQFTQTEKSETQMAEIQIGAKHASISNQEIIEYFSNLLN